MIPEDVDLQIGSLLFEGVDQIDVTGPFEVFSRLPNSTYRLFAATTGPVCDTRGLRLMGDALLSDAPQLDVLHVPGGPGQEALMENEEILGWLRQQAAGARCIFSVCTGALVCGAAGLIKGRRATTHWNSHHLLPYFGATPINERVVIDGHWVFAAGVTAGIDGALRVPNPGASLAAKADLLWIDNVVRQTANQIGQGFGIIDAPKGVLIFFVTSLRLWLVLKEVLSVSCSG